MTTFIGTNLIANPHLQFYKAMRRLIYSQGEDEESLFGDWLGEEEQPPAVASTTPARGLATSLAQRLAEPGNASLASAEVAR